jgi:AcrR family transcriptional regulator
MEAADRVFVAEGYRGATIRAIAREAQTGLATLSRHWPGKQELFLDVFSRHFEPIHRKQTILLDAVEKDAAARGAPPTAEEVLRAFYGPAVGAGEPLLGIGRTVYCRALTDPSSEVKRIVAALIGDVRARVILMLRRALPHLGDSDFFLAINVVMGVYVFPQVFGHQLASAMGVGPATIDWPTASDRLAALVATSLNQPAIPGKA